jgi:superfamily II DNA or RNA helicase
MADRKRPKKSPTAQAKTGGELRISQTGVRDGETIQGDKIQTKGIVLKIKGAYPPSRPWVDTLEENVLRDYFNNIPFFADMSSKERLDWLQTHSTPDNDLYLEDVPKLKVKFVNIGDTNFLTETLASDVVDRLLAGNPDDDEGYWDISTVYELFPRKPGSKARKTTLIFRPSNWTLLNVTKLSRNYEGVYMDVDTFEIRKGRPDRAYVFDTTLGKVGITYSKTRTKPFTFEYLAELASRWVPVAEIQRVKTLIDWFPPSMYKSLIQKLIRTRCVSVSHHGHLYSAKSVLITAMILNMLHPGAFVPNIRKFVGGMESMVKRLGVTIYEDGYVSEEHSHVLPFLFATTLLLSEEKNWKPLDSTIVQWFEAALYAQESKHMYEYKTTGGFKITDMNVHSYSFMLLDTIRSFVTDINLVAWTAVNHGKIRTTTNNQISIMPLVHCIDQHSYTDIAYFMPYTGVNFTQVFQTVWTQATGINPRKPQYSADTINLIEFDPQVAAIRHAQYATWLLKQNKTKSKRPVLPGETVDLNYKLADSWLAGFVGVIEVKVGKKNVYVVLNPDDVRDLIPVKKPSRDKEDTELSEKEKDQAIALARESLRKGYKLRIPQSLKSLKGKTLYLREDDNYYLGDQSWDEASNLDVSVPIHPPLEINFANAITHTGTGVDVRLCDILRAIKNVYPLEVIKRLAVYLGGFKSFIELNKISRDGTGTYYAVNQLDIQVNQILCHLTIMAPGAIEISANGFKVKNGPLLWIIRDKLLRRLSREVDRKSKWELGPKDEREAREHQRLSLNKMVLRNQTGKRGNILWLPVGLGKTKIVADYIRYLYDNDKLPKYVVYTLPPSAIDNVKREFERSGIPTKLIDARKGADNVFEPYKANFIRHDQLRLTLDQLRELAPNMLFIVDEFHKTLAETLRTSAALEISHLAKDFIALSGTIIKDTSHEELIKWLEQIVDFEVDENNFWVAVASLISHKVNTGVKIRRDNIDLVLQGELRREYYNVVPEKLGGKAKEIDFRRALEISYEAVNAHLISLTREYVMRGEGVFLVAKDNATARELKRQLGLKDSEVFIIDNDHQITLLPTTKTPVKVVITTKQYSEGYTLTKFGIMITSVYLSNQATREQLEGRINRIGQTRPEISIITVHAGILSYIFEKYENARSLSEVLKGFAKDIKVRVEDLNM